MVAGAECIDHCDVLRSGSTGSVLGHDVMAPSTLGTFLRSFTFGHVRQLDSFSEPMLTGAWDFGAGPGHAPMTIDIDIDIDSTIQQVYGKRRQGAAYGYTGVLGEHPLVATRADTGEVLHVRQGKGSAGSGRGAPRFVRETIGRVRRAGATGQLTLRADSTRWPWATADNRVLQPPAGTVTSHLIDHQRGGPPRPRPSQLDRRRSPVVAHVLIAAEFTQCSGWHQLPGQDHESAPSPLRFGGSRLRGSVRDCAAPWCPPLSIPI
jgi:hypothetical protein